MVVDSHLEFVNLHYIWTCKQVTYHTSNVPPWKFCENRMGGSKVIPYFKIQDDFQWPSWICAFTSYLSIETGCHASSVLSWKLSWKSIKPFKSHIIIQNLTWRWAAILDLWICIIFEPVDRLSCQQGSTLKISWKLVKRFKSYIIIQNSRWWWAAILNLWTYIIFEHADRLPYQQGSTLKILWKSVS